MASLRIDDLIAQFEPARRGTFRIMQYCILAVGLAAMTAMTVPAARAEAGFWLTAALWLCTGFFAFELALKAWVSLSSGPRTGSAGAPNYLWSGSAAIDALAVLPAPLALAFGTPPETAWLFGSLWLLKLAEVVPGLSTLGRVVRLEARPLASVLVIFLMVLLVSGVALHVLERAGQPERFGTLPRSLWWAVTTLTTTGYGDSVPETFLGRMIAGAVMICGLGVFGLWTGILATGFAAEHRRRDFVRNWDMVTRVPFMSSLDAPAIIELTRMLRRLDLAERSIVVRRGRPGDCMYFIASGEVEVKLEPKPIRLGAGAFFGEIALLDGSPRNATVMTTAATTLLVLDVTDFRAFAAHHPGLAQAVEEEAARRRSETGKTDSKAESIDAPPAGPQPA